MIREIYYNINKRVFSIRAKKTPVTYTVAARVDLPKFVVREGGRQQVLREKQKNVHAFIKGEMETLDHVPCLAGLRKVSYNPYYAGHFYDCETHTAIHAAQYAVLLLDENKRPQVYIKC